MKNSIIILSILYLLLVLVSFGIYQLLLRFIEDEGQQSMLLSLLSWSATMFATIALLYTFNNWRNQRAIEIIAGEAKNIIEQMNAQLAMHRVIVLSRNYDQTYLENLKQLNLDYYQINKSLTLLDKLLKAEYSKKNYTIFQKVNSFYLQHYITFKDTYHYLYNYKVHNLAMSDTPDLYSINENYAIGHHDLHEVLIKISLHHNSLS